MGKFLAKKFQNKEGYQLGERPKNREFIKINANESPYPPSPRVLKAITEQMVAEQNLYADPKSAELTRAIAEYYGVGQDEVFADSGSDVILAYCLVAYGTDGGFRFPDVTYNFYRTFSNFFGIGYREIPVAEDFSISAADYCGCGSHVLLANPNAPSGLVLSMEEVERIVASNPGRLVIIDEAYVDYGNESCIPLIKRYDNLLVIHTMSKSLNLAGARIGFAVSCPENIRDLSMMKAAFNPDSINTISQALGCAAVKDREYMESCVKKILRTREKTREALLKRGFGVPESHTNFLFAKPPVISAGDYYLQLKENGVLIRYFDQPRIRDYVRITIGTEEQMEEVIARTDRILSRQSFRMKDRAAAAGAVHMGGVKSRGRDSIKMKIEGK